jgi:hypothetical protein
LPAIPTEFTNKKPLIETTSKHHEAIPPGVSIISLTNQAGYKILVKG